MKPDVIRGFINMMRLQDKVRLAGGGLDIDGLNTPKVEGISLGEGLMPYDVSDVPQLALGCTFSPELCRKAALYKARKSAESGHAFAGVVRCGLMRDPMNVDASEFFSEDAFLTSQLLGGFAAEQGFGFVFTDALGQGRFVNRTIDARALNELYLMPLAAQGRRAAAIQSDGGRLNGEIICLSRTAFEMYARFIDDDTAVFTQYYNDFECSEQAVTGAYMLGADNEFKYDVLGTAVADGVVSDETLRKGIERTLAAMIKTHDFYKSPMPQSIKAATPPDLTIESAVLLKNSGVLPVRTNNVHIFGNRSAFADGGNYSIIPLKDAGKSLGAFNVFLLTDYEENGIDPAVASAICGAATVGDTVVVLCGLCAAPLGFVDRVGAVIFCPTVPRIYDILSMLTGAAPKGRLPFTWCRSAADYPCNGKKFADRGDFRYESLYNGYLLFNNFKSSAVMFPFGHGMDYAQYELSRVTASSKDTEITVEFVIKNIGLYAGDTVVQAYVTALGAPVYGMTKRLAAFKRVKLDRTENARVTLKIDLRDIPVFDEANNEFVVLGGRYRVEVGLSSVDIRAAAEVRVAVGSRVNAGLSEKLAPSYYAVGEAFNPTAPEIERLLKVPFIKKPDECPELAPPSASAIKKPLKKAEKFLPEHLRPLLRYKIKTTPELNIK